jgi:hypothetical protein
VVYVTSGLVDVLLDFASDADPDPVTALLAVTPAGDIPDTDLPPETPVFTDFYLPDTGESVRAVFGVDLATPVGQTQGRFVSHPIGELALDTTDDLHQVVFVAVPPWTPDDVAAFDRSGRKQELDVLDVEPREETFT